ncbi:MAG TPA: hypothetical protein VF229_02160, partial [Burkholderiaceae bacterium]
TTTGASMRIHYSKLSRYVPGAATLCVVLVALALGLLVAPSEPDRAHTVARAAVRLADADYGRFELAASGIMKARERGRA